MSIAGMALRGTARWSFVGRLLVAGEIALAAKRHFDNLESKERAELRGLITKSKGKPGNLTSAERSRVMTLVKKLEPTAFARNAAKSAIPLRRK